jgi:hemerythrin
MRYIPWSPGLETGFKDVDEQHKELYALVNDLSAGTVIDADSKDVSRELARICRYTGAHFATEEALMERTNYSDAHVHMEVHREFAEAVDSMAQAYDSGAGKNVSELSAFMHDWLSAHIPEWDRPFVHHVHEWQQRGGSL